MEKPVRERVDEGLEMELKGEEESWVWEALVWVVIWSLNVSGSVQGQRQ
jgi:hypothetical protein